MEAAELLAEIRKKWVLYALLAPTFIGVLAFYYFPALSALYFGFTDWNGARANFVGLRNFQDMLEDRILVHSVWNAVRLTIFRTIFPVLIPLIAAELVFWLRSTRLQYAYRVLFVIPMVVPGIVTLYLWQYLYDPNVGFINSFLQLVGLGRFQPGWLADSDTALYSIMVVGFPWVAGYPFLLFLAALQGIPEEIFDAATVDGVGALQRFIRIEIPLLTSQIQVILILAMIGSVQGFLDILILTGGGPGTATMVPALVMLEQAFGIAGMSEVYKWGYASAIGAVMFLVIAGLTLLQFSLRKRDGETATTEGAPPR